LEYIGRLLGWLATTFSKEKKMKSKLLIEMHSVRKTYPMGDLTVHALRGLDLTVAQGEFIVLLGPSGSGKTTTLNILGGLDRPSDGRVVVDGEEIVSLSERGLTRYRRTKVGFIFQFFNLIPTLTALENVEFALALTQSNISLKNRAHKLLTAVSLQDRADHFPSQLSGGEQQRVAIARSLANKPPLLLADEPTGNLDIETGRQVLQAIRDLNQREGATVVLVTHNVNIAPMADRVVRLHDGSVACIESNTNPAPVAELTW
jgi:putative ABC transport system ATP-binding protein